MSKKTFESGSDNYVIRNSGLRPSWDVFWAIEAEGIEDKRKVPPTPVPSPSNVSTGSGNLKHVRFITGSQWTGEWDKFGMSGIGTYRMPHGVTYEGTMNKGVMDGYGVLKYPNGGTLEGLWYAGKLKYWNYEYADGLEDVDGEQYCEMPDRRFHSERLIGLKSANEEQISNDDPPRVVPPGCYDVGCGFYNPKTKCVTDPVSGDVLSIPTVFEEKWILEKCRSSDIGTVGYRPDLYENWFIKGPYHTKKTKLNSKTEIFELIRQEGFLLDDIKADKASLPRNTSTGHTVSVTRSESHTEKVSDSSKTNESEKFTINWDEISSRSTSDFEMFIKKFAKELEDSRGKTFLKPDLSEALLLKTESSKEQTDTMCDEDMGKVLNNITTLSGKIGHSKRRTTNTTGTANEDTVPPLSIAESLTNRFKTKTNLDQTSETSKKTMPFFFSDSSLKLLSFLTQESDQNEEYRKVPIEGLLQEKLNLFSYMRSLAGADFLDPCYELCDELMY